MNKSHLIIYFGQFMRVNCDRNCGKAWGINNRPRAQLSQDEDDYYFLADGELDTAPADPGTYEGRDAKPKSPSEFPNKWCVRECERCAKTDIGKFADEPELPDYSVRRYNLPWRNIS